MTELGPVQLISVAFGPDANFEGRIIDELVALEGKETIRVLDLLFVLKDAETGELVALDHQGAELGAIVGALLGFDFESEAARQVLAGDDGGHAFGLSQADIEAFGRSLEPGTAAGFLLIEHIWARDLKRALRDAGGVPIGEGFLTPEAVAAVSGELVAMAAAIEELEREQARAGSGV
jgi:uncharacterized membrane protein